MFMAKSTDQLRAYLIDVTFFTWPEPASGYHHLVIVSQTAPNKEESEEIARIIAFSRIGNKLEESVLNDKGYGKWQFKGKFIDHSHTPRPSGPNEVNVTIDISDLGNLLTDLEGQIHYIGGRVRYLDKKRQIIPVYGSIEEIRSNAQMSDLTYRVR